MSLPEPVHARCVRVSTIVGELWFPADDLVMLPYLRSAGAWEPMEGELLVSLLKPDSRFLDVGANVGYFSALAARCCGQGTIDAVEPDARNLALLRMNLWLHAPHARIWPVALGQTRSVVGLSLDEANYGNTRVAAAETTTTQLSALVPADELFPERSFDVIKVDVQGFEVDVVLGMQKLLRRSPHPCLVVEFFPRAIEDRGMQPMDVLRIYRDLGLQRVASVNGKLDRLDEEETLALCRNAGADGFVNLVLRK